MIEGHREIVVDNEKQIMSIVGLVRPKDIDANNLISSSNVANAKITYTGAGVLSDAMKKGMFSTFVDWVWPFS